MRFRTYYHQGYVNTADVETDKIYICERYSQMKDDISALVLSGRVRLTYIEEFPIRTFTYINFIYYHSLTSFNCEIHEDIEFQQLMSVLESVDLEIALKTKT